MMKNVLKRCPFCEPDTFYPLINGVGENKKKRCVVQVQNRIYEKVIKVTVDGIHHAITKINYCPICGKKL